jgi:hypothetical protein
VHIFVNVSLHYFPTILSEIGLYFFPFLETFLNMVVTFPHFHSVGNILVDNERLNSLHRGYFKIDESSLRSLRLYQNLVLTSRISVYSFRSGRATTALQNDTPYRLFTTHGSWKSDKSKDAPLRFRKLTATFICVSESRLYKYVCKRLSLCIEMETAPFCT